MSGCVREEGCGKNVRGSSRTCRGRVVVGGWARGEEELLADYHCFLVRISRLSEAADVGAVSPPPPTPPLQRSFPFSLQRLLGITCSSY